MSYGKIGKMKYLEEITPGDIFYHNNQIYVLTSDFKNSGSRMSVSLDNGFPIWLDAQTIIETLPLFKLDKDNNIIPIKNVPAPSTNIS